MYRVTNIYGIAGETKHRKLECAIREASRREGAGWIVVDDDDEQVSI